MIRQGVLAVIVPAYNEESNILPAAKRISRILADAGIMYQIIFVDDGSTDATWGRILETAESFPYVSGLHFSRNFGKESAIYAGLNNMDAECCAVIDSDLQHPPEKLVEMYKMWQKGIDVVEGIKSDRGAESVLHTSAANGFYGIIGKLTGYELKNTSDFKLIDKEVVNVIRRMPERNTFFRAMSYWVGFKSAAVEYEVQERVFGETKWSAAKLLKYAMNNVAAFSTAPLQIVTWLGVFSIVFGMVFGAISLIQKIMGTALGGFTTVIILLAFIGGIIMLSLGIIGFYIAKIYSEVQNRPRYIISATCGVENEDTKLVG